MTLGNQKKIALVILSLVLALGCYEDTAVPGQSRDKAQQTIARCERLCKPYNFSVVVAAFGDPAGWCRCWGGPSCSVQGAGADSEQNLGDEMHH